MKNLFLVLALLGSSTMLPAQTTTKIPKVYQPVKKSMYHKGWIDFNKNGVMDVYENPNAKIEDRIEDLLGQMNMEEKTCQMVTLYGYKRVLKDALPTSEWKNMLWKDGMGAIDEHLNGFQQWGLPPSDNENVWPASRHAWALNEVQRFFVEDTRLGIPVDFTNEGIRGVESYRATNFPTQLGLGHTWNRNLIYKVGRITGREGRMLGYTNVYAPILDVGRDQRWGRYEEVYGESPYLVAELGIEMVKGMQYNYQVAATGKHFIAYSNNKGAREGMARVDPQMSPREVEMIHVYPFKRVIKEAGLLGVMSSYNDYDGEPISGSYHFLTEILRQEWGFKGYVVSDSEAVEFVAGKHKVADTYEDGIAQCVNAGLNVRTNFTAPDEFVIPLRKAIADGKISFDTVDKRVAEILRVKFWLGLFDHPYRGDGKLAEKIVHSKEHQAVALDAARQSLVLLKNEKEMLPLSKSIRKVAVIGPNAEEKKQLICRYGPTNAPIKTVFQGIKEMLPDAEVVYRKGCDIVDPHFPESEILDFPKTEEESRLMDEAVAAAQNAEVAIMVLGGNELTVREDRSRTSLELPGRQEELLKAVMGTGTPVVLVLLDGRAATINYAAATVPAILHAWFPGEFCGQVVAEALFGDYNPGGRLAVTFPKSVGQIPFAFPFKPGSDVPASTSVYGALYPFGYGLSYTSFVYSDLQITPKEQGVQGEVNISCKVKNAGKVKGDEVVQLYLRDEVSSVTTYTKVLRGFERISLEPGEEKIVRFKLCPQDLGLWDKNMNFCVEPGSFKVMVGASSADIRLEGNFEVI